jgi:hypothetical protein
MHAVVVSVTINDNEAATEHLRSSVVPGVKQAPGLVAAYWVRIDGKGRSMGIFESEDAARAAADRIPEMVTDAVTLESVDVGEVVESA